MTHVKKFTEEFRRDELRRGEESLFYFGCSILGFGDPDKVGPLQADLCAFLEGRRPHHPWRRAVVCAYRGAAKSTWTTQAYPTWRCLYIPDFTVKIIENSSDNAYMNHFAPIVDIFVNSRRSDYLQWLFSHRLPDGFVGWNSRQIQFKKEDPLSAPSITYWGLESKMEGWHGDLVILDDADGADADKNPDRNHDAYKAYTAAIPLLKEPRNAQLLVVGTPHGPDPLVYQLRERELEGRIDNKARNIKVWWKEIYDEEGNVREPHRFPPSIISELKTNPESWNKDYLLKRPGSAVSFFDMGQVMEDCFEWADREQTILRYWGFEYDEQGLAEGELIKTDRKLCHVHLSECRPYMHIDPTHKISQLMGHRLSHQRPSEMALVVPVVAPDFHVFLWRFWHADADIDELVRQMFRFYRLCGPASITYEGTGAQTWLVNFVKQAERADRRLLSVETTGHIWAPMGLPKMSSRLVEHEKGNLSKEEVWRAALGPWLHHGILHLHQSQEEPLAQLRGVTNPRQKVDLVDCLAQGPQVWSPPAAADLFRGADRRMRFALSKVAQRTGYLRPRRGGRLPGRRSHAS